MNRLLLLLLVELHSQPNKWLTYFTSSENRQTLPLFTSLINIVFTYDPVGYLPYNYLLFSDTREPLVEIAAQFLCVTLDNNSLTSSIEPPSSPTSSTPPNDENSNLFLSYLARIHRDDVRKTNRNDSSRSSSFFYFRILIFY